MINDETLLKAFSTHFYGTVIVKSIAQYFILKSNLGLLSSVLSLFQNLLIPVSLDPTFKSLINPEKERKVIVLARAMHMYQEISSVTGFVTSTMHVDVNPVRQVTFVWGPGNQPRQATK